DIPLNFLVVPDADVSRQIEVVSDASATLEKGVRFLGVADIQNVAALHERGGLAKPQPISCGDAVQRHRFFERHRAAARPIIQTRRYWHGGVNLRLTRDPGASACAPSAATPSPRPAPDPGRGSVAGAPRSRGTDGRPRPPGGGGSGSCAGRS